MYEATQQLVLCWNSERLKQIISQFFNYTTLKKNIVFLMKTKLQ
jgi:hypothetical protein